MNTHVRRRLARLEAKRVNRVSHESDLSRLKLKSALISIVAFHAGELALGDSLATALARGLGITAVELKNALKPNSYDRRDIWALVLEKLNDLIVARGGHPLTENGLLILEALREDEDRRNGLEMLDQLYEEIPEVVKERHRLLPHLANYLA